MRRRLINLLTLLLTVAAGALLPLWARSYWTGMSLKLEMRNYNFQEVQLSRGALVWRTPYSAPEAATRLTYTTWPDPSDPVGERGQLPFRLRLSGAAFGTEPQTNLAVHRIVVPLPWLLAFLLTMPAMRLAGR